MGNASLILIGFALGIALASLFARVVTRRAIAKVRAAERRARTAERLAELGGMTGGLAHEIKNPLSSIGLNAQLLAEGLDELPVDPDAKAKLHRRVGSLKREVDRLKGILTDFLEYAGELKLARADTDVNTIVDELSDFFMPQAQASGVRVRVDLAPGPLIAPVDATHVKQALLNLMLNAVQAMTQADSPAKELIVKTAASRDAERRPVVLIHVIDTGPGIEPSVRERLFTPYLTTKPGGSGLGLSTTRRLIEAHGGRIDVHTEQGRGTDFVVTLPAVG